jgi:hypothetical protein
VRRTEKRKRNGKALEGNWRDETDKEKRSKRNETFLKRRFLRTYHDVAVDEGYSFISIKYFAENGDRIIIIFIMALQSFVGFWLLFRFLMSYTACRTL